MITVAFEGRARQQAAGGVHTYVEQLYQQLRQRPDIAVKQLANPRSRWLIPTWLNKDVPRQMQIIKPNVAHFTKAAVPRQKKYPTVVTIYDIIPMLLPQSQKWLARMYWPQALRHAARVSDHIMTISDRSRADIIKHLQVAEAKVTVTALGVDNHAFKPAKLSEIQRVKKSYNLPQEYLLFVGTIEPRKNIPALIRSFGYVAGDIPHALVIAGRHYKGLNQIGAEIRRLKLSDRIKILDFVTAEDLPALYSGADFFLWPSIYEGWGFPPAEAMACGTPVIVSDGGSLPEVVGEAGVIVPFTARVLVERLHDSAFERRLASATGALISDRPRRQAMSEQGRRHVANFSWQEVADKTIAVYKRIAD